MHCLVVPFEHTASVLVQLSQTTPNPPTPVRTRPNNWYAPPAPAPRNPSDNLPSSIPRRSGCEAHPMNHSATIWTPHTARLPVSASNSLVSVTLNGLIHTTHIMPATSIALWVMLGAFTQGRDGCRVCAGEVAGRDR